MLQQTFFFSVSNMSNLHACPIYVVVDPNVTIVIHLIKMFQYIFPLLQVHIGFVLGQSSLTSVSTTSDGNEKLRLPQHPVNITQTNKFVYSVELNTFCPCHTNVTHPAEIWTQKNWTLSRNRTVFYVESKVLSVLRILVLGDNKECTNMY